MADGRFAPSPTGALHVGNLRTALLAWLFARSAGSRFLLRFEDLDPAVVRAEHFNSQMDDLRALGLDWDGRVWWQSERREAHDEAIAALEERGLTYGCYCTRREVLESAQAPHGPGSEGGYPGTCRELGARERVVREREGRRPALRLRASGACEGFHDRIHGWKEGVVDDFVLRRADGVPAYNLAVVVDDLAQGVAEVVRGDDLLHTTTRQAYLARLLGHEPPGYAHVPLVLAPDGSRLAKRHGSVTLDDRRALGESPAVVLGWLAASLGLVSAGEEASADGLLTRFDPDRLPREPWTLSPADLQAPRR